jgi:hypothetical protein
MRRILTVTFSNQKFAPGGMNPRGNPDCRVLRWQNRIKDTDQTTKYPSMSEEVTMQAGEPSHTARGAAAYRAIHQTLEGGAIFSDPFASKILDDETRARLDETAADPSLRPMRLFIAARSRFSEDTLAAGVARGVRQVVVLGAGLDTFSLRNPYAGLGVRVFEVDYPATQQWKRERLNEAGLAIHLRTRRLRAAKPGGWSKGSGFRCRSSGVLPVAWCRALSDARGGLRDVGFHRSCAGIGSGVRLRRAV